MTRLAVPAVCLGLLPLLTPVGRSQPTPTDKAEYVKKATRSETARAILKSVGLPTLEGKWYYAGPFDTATKDGVETVFPPEKGVDLKAAYTGKDGAKFGWKEVPEFQLGKVYSLLRLF